MTNKNFNENRRDFLKKTGLLSLGVAGAGSVGFTRQEQAVADGLYNVHNFGAKGDGATLNTKSIQSAIDACARGGGGTVYFPTGKFVSGTLFLKSHVTLYLEAGAVLEGSKNLNDYPVTVPDVRSYTDNYTNKSLIYGEGLENIAITGYGTLDGNGASFKPGEDLMKTDRFAWYKARPYIIRIINCKKVQVRDVTIINSPMWVQHYLSCENVNIDGITVNSGVNQNNDGIDIDGCNNVRISNCDIYSGTDDAIVLKSTLDKPCKNITITNCVLSSPSNAFKLGTESNGGFQNISLSNCIIYNTRGAGIALEMVDGGSLNNVSVSDVNMDNVGCAIFVRLGNRARPYLENDAQAYFNREAAKQNLPKPGMGSLFNVIISNIQATNIGKTGCSITGLPSYPVRNITLNNIRLHFEGGGTEDLITRKIEEFPEKYPGHSMFGTLPAYGFFCRHVSGLNIDNMDLSYKNAEHRPALFIQDVKDTRISDLKSSYEKGAKSMMIIDNSKDIIVRECNAIENIEALSSIKNDSKNIGFINCNILSKNKIFRTDETVKKSEIIIK